MNPHFFSILEELNDGRVTVRIEEIPAAILVEGPLVEKDNGRERLHEQHHFLDLLYRCIEKFEEMDKQGCKEGSLRQG